MEATELVLGRRSIGKLGEPAPEGEALERILRAALRAPDHGALRPWKILLVRGDARERFGQLTAEALRRRKPDANDAELTREKDKSLRAPLMVIVVAALKPSPKIPELEQLLSAGAVAHGLGMAAQAEGFGSIWKTGDAVYDRFVHEKLGLAESDRIVGIIYVGTAKEMPPEVPRPRVEDFVVDWHG